MKKLTMKIFSFALAMTMLLALSSASFAAPNAELGLWRDLKIDAGGVVHRVGHKPNGEKYIIFARQYYNEFPSVTRWSSHKETKEHWLELTFPEKKTFNKIDLCNRKHLLTNYRFCADRVLADSNAFQDGHVLWLHSRYNEVA